MVDRPDHPPAPPREMPTLAVARIRVRYCECDPQRVVHHASYVPWLEEARTEILRQAGISYAELERANVFLAVARLDIRYRRPGYYDDELHVEARVVGGHRARIDHEYTVWREGESRDQPLIEASSTLACVDGDGRPTAMPDWLVPTQRVRR